MGILAIVNVVGIACVAYVMWKRQEAEIKPFFWPGLFVKAGAGFALGWLYLGYYKTGDTLLYFQDARVIAELARRDPMAYLQFLWNSEPALNFISDVNTQPRVLFMIKLASVTCLAGGDSYWIAALYFSVLSFAGAWMLVRAIARYIPPMRIPAVVAFLFWPGAVFWSSGLIKEALAMAALYALSAVFLNVWFAWRVRYSETAIALLSLWIVWSLKYYFLAVWLPFALAALTVQYVSTIVDRREKLRVPAWWRTRSFMGKLVVWVIALALPVMLLSGLHPNFHPTAFLEVITTSHDAFVALSDAEDLIVYRDLQPAFISLLAHAPKAVFAGLFRPLPWEATNVLQLAASVENMCVLFLAVAALFRIPRLIRSANGLLAISVVLYAIVLAGFLALSTPNFGTLSRYRVGFSGFLVCVLLSGHVTRALFSSALQRYRSLLAP